MNKDDGTRHNRAENLIDHLGQMLGKSERMWIDRMACESHGLTDEKIAIVEGSAGKGEK
ncbi:MAG: hypothetical protein ABIF19_14090 [Planctomycetota bacterium]